MQTEYPQGAFCSKCGCWRGQLGLEPTWQLYIAHLCECAEEWWRVLKPTGNLFVNIGDSFFGGKGKSGQGSPECQAARSDVSINKPRDHIAGPGKTRPQDIAGAGIPKMKLGIPFRLRFALNDMGWVSRDDIVWYKGKEYPDGRISKVAMPESVKRRFACSYEMVMRFVKTPKMNYYVSEKTLESKDRPPKERVEGQDFEWREHTRCGGKGCNSPRCKDGFIKYSFWHGVDQWFDLDAVRRPHQGDWGLRDRSQMKLRDIEQYGKTALANSNPHPSGSNPGDIWIIQPEPFRLEHYAVWPSKLCEMMIKAGCPKEVCPECGKPRERIVKIENPRTEAELQEYLAEARAKGLEDSARSYAGIRTLQKHGVAKKHLVGWSDCGCNEGFVPGVVLDPFGGGSGRLAKEARKLGRRAIIIDLKEEYLEMSKDCLTYGEKELFKEKKRREKTGMSQGILW